MFKDKNYFNSSTILFKPGKVRWFSIIKCRFDLLLDVDFDLIMII